MRAVLLLAVVLLLAACTGAPPVSPSPEPTPQPTPGDTVRILATELWGDYPNAFAVDAATDAEEYEVLWGRVGQGEPQPEVDFTRELVLYLGMAGSSSCPERFERLELDATSRLFAVWAERDASQPCTDDLAPQGLLLAVARSELPSEPFLFSLREQPVCPECPDFGDQMTVDPR